MTSTGFWPIIRWWEVRRPFFNLVVGTTGLVTCAIFLATGTVTEKLTGDAIGIPDPPIFAVFGAILYGIVANICYPRDRSLKSLPCAAGRKEPAPSVKSLFLSGWFHPFSSLFSLES